MNIIRGNQRHLVPDSYTVLELDTFETSTGTCEAAYCVIENIPLQDFPTLDAHVCVHHDLMEAYRQQNWEYCCSAIQWLLGKWDGVLDSFYNDLLQRVHAQKDLSFDPEWTGRRCVVRASDCVTVAMKANAHDPQH